MKSQYVLFCLICLLFGCNYDAHPTLIAVDNLMTDNKDSAYLLIKNIDPQQLRGGNNRAYYALLYTQAQYKNYETIQSDSLIDIAVEYYTKRNNKKLLTQAYLYKGAALSDMRIDLEAMEWYKKAEQMADSSDYLTLGLINSRMGNLYQRHYSVNEQHIEKYKKALNYYRLSGQKIYQKAVLGTIGQLYILRSTDSSYLYLNQAIEISREIKDSAALFSNHYFLAKTYIQAQSYNKAKDVLLYILNNRKQIPICNDTYYTLSSTYAILGKIDSAEYYLSGIQTIGNSIDTMRYFMTLENIAKAKGDFRVAYYNTVKATKIADTAISKSRKNDIYTTEKQFDKALIQKKAKQLQTDVKIRNYLISVILLIILSTAWIVITYWRRKRRLFLEQARLAEQLQTELQYHKLHIDRLTEQHNEILSTMDETLAERHEIEQSLKAMIEDRMQIMRKLMNIKHEYGFNPEIFIRRFEQTISLNKKSRKDGDQIIAIANRLNDNLIDRIATSEPSLKYNDKLMLSLICLQFSPVEMGVFLNNPNPDSIYSARYRLAKKLNADSIEEYFLRVQGHIG